ncbi:MAG: ABC transporter ATP-binding protein [Pseudomonadota bacterium]
MSDADSGAAGTVSRLIEPVKGRLYLACVLQGVGAVAGVAPFIAVVELARVLLADGTVDARRAWQIAGIAVAALTVRLLAILAASSITHLADLDLQLDLRRRLAAVLARVPLGWYDTRHAGEVKKVLQDDVATLHHLVAHSYTNTVAAIIAPLTALTYLLWLDWRMTVVAVLPLALGILLYALQYRGYGEKMRGYNEALEKVNAASVEFVQGIAVIKTFGQARKAYQRFIDGTTAFVAYFWEWMRGLLAISAASEVVLSPLFALLVVLIGGVAFVGAGVAAPVDVLAFVVLAPALTAPFLTVAYSQNDLMLAADAAKRIGELLQAPILATAEHPRVPEGTRVVLDHVSFSYDRATKALQDISLVLEPGTITALVGPSGSGKTTLARLLPRFWDVDEGCITVGDVDLRDIAPNELYGYVSFVFQDVQLLHTTIAENIALARPDASDEEIEAAARAAQIHDRIAALPRGYRSVLGEDAHLSGGEAQRVSIAVPCLPMPRSWCWTRPRRSPTRTPKPPYKPLSPTSSKGARSL